MPAALHSITDVAETIEATGSSLATPVSGDGSDALKQAARRRVALVEGSTPHMSAETRAVLRTRLRIAALVLAATFGAFLAWALVRWPLAEHLEPGNGGVFYAHVGVTLLLALAARKLCAKCDLSLRSLRVAEALVFGAPAAFLILVDAKKLQLCATLTDGHAHIPTVVAAWMLLTFCYAMFVPNTWQRASWAIGALVLAPAVVNQWAYWTIPQFRALSQTEDFRGVMSEQALAMALAGMAAVVGVHTINALRREAFVAKQLGQYRLKERLGSGGMGEVYLAEHQMMKRPCAVKVIRPEKAGDPKTLARFEREVRATAKLSHWNSIDIYDYGRTEDGTFYYVMEFLPGHNWGELVELHGPLPTSRIVYLMLQVCDALAEAHGQGLIHRDIKPANLYCAFRGGMFDVAKLLDFGLAKPMATATDAGLTQEGAITGSPMFMSPEQATGSDQLDERSDIYSLGAVMYYVAAGQPPFAYERPLQVMIAHASEEPRLLREAGADVPAELEEVVRRCLEKRPEDRYQSVRELRDALAGVPTEAPWTADLAASWWTDFGCPRRKALARQVEELAYA